MLFGVAVATMLMLALTQRPATDEPVGPYPCPIHTA